MPVSKAVLNEAERIALLSHLQKHKIYPFRYRFSKTINAANFPTAAVGGTAGSYFTLTFQPKEILGIITLSNAFIITPNTTVDTFSIAVSYKKTWAWGDNTVATVPDDEGSEIYSLLSNGGAINDFQVFYPTTYYMERNTPIYIHVFAGATTVAAGTSTMTGAVIIGTLPTGA